MRSIVLSLIAAALSGCTIATNEMVQQGTPPKRVPSPCVVPDRGEVRIVGGTFLMGSQEFYDEEGPIRQVTVGNFSIDRFDVTNSDFAKFVAATGYVTDAERKPAPKDYPEIPPDMLVPGGAVFTPEDDEWWQFVGGSNWRHPHGARSSIAGRDNDPVVQVSYSDALAYARWVGRDLPTEEQYEYAARGGLISKTYPWGNELTPGGKWMANVWQGRFPREPVPEDGYPGIAPVGCFPPNGYGLYDMVGNLWKWTSSLSTPTTTAAKAHPRAERIIKGGSFMCSVEYCRRFRPAARQTQESGFSSMHLGFRTVSNRQSPT